MKPADACARCGSTKIIPRARVVDRGENDSQSHSLRVAVARNPEAVFFKKEEKVDTYARVCGECGFVELFAKDPYALYEAYLIARSTPEP
jgi:ribosomal protein S27AE